jgi:quinolinate synthase
MSGSLQDEIKQLKDEKNAIILAHNYQPKEIQEIADFLGDSLELCMKAAEIEDKDLVIFCGVDFMAETAYILNPDKKIVIPDLEAECPMAHMLPEDELLKAKEEHPDAGVILYVNSIAEAKQHADTLCTSANALKVTESLPQDEILFGPDNNLGSNVAKQTSKEIIPVPKGGHCYVHKLFHIEDVELKRKQHPNAEIICHPECNIDVQEACDKVLSTGGMLKYIAQSDKDEFVILSDMLLRSMKKAIYSTNNIGHFGLASKNYTHFTSPIRRFPDLTVHRLLRTYLFENRIDLETINFNAKYLIDVAEHSSETEVNSIEAERDVLDMKMAEYMEKHVGEEYDGIISGVTNFGLFVELDNLVEGLVHISTLNGFYTYVPEMLSLISSNKKKKYRIGDKVRIIVTKASKKQGIIDFELVGDNNGNNK